MMKNWKTAFGTAIVCLMAAQAQAGAIDALKQFNSDADGISGNFTQTVRARNKNQTASGTFQILRPGLFKWSYTRPYKQVIVGDGSHIWLYDMDLKQVTRSNQDQTIGDSPAAILSNKSALESSYTKTATKTALIMCWPHRAKTTRATNSSASASKATHWPRWS